MLEPGAASLDGKVAVVTGGGGGIGRSISETFAAHGARVVVAECDARRAEETTTAISSRGGHALPCVVDVREREQVTRMAENALDAFGRVDVLVNNVGDFLRTGAFAESSEEDWDDQYQVNLLHVFRCTRALVPQMIERGEGGCVINVSTIEVFRGVPGAAVYTAFKTAITGFTRALALELGPHRIRVNAIAPETTDTHQVPIFRWIGPDNHDRIPYWIPLGRFGTPDDAAGCALFLASELSAWVTGATLPLDGGAIAASGFYRVPGGGWTNLPVVTGSGIDPP